MWGPRRPPGRHCRGTERGAPGAAGGAGRGENRGPAEPSRSPARPPQELRAARGSRLVLAGGRGARWGERLRRLSLSGLFLGNGGEMELRDGEFVLCGQRCFLLDDRKISTPARRPPTCRSSIRAPDGSAASARSRLGPAAGCLRAPGTGLRFRAAGSWAGCSLEGPSVGTCCHFGVWNPS